MILNMQKATEPVESGIEFTTELDIMPISEPEAVGLGTEYETAVCCKKIRDSSTGRTA